MCIAGSKLLREVFELELPCGRRSRQVLACDASALMLGLPGLALPDSALATAMLPSVPDMTIDSLHASRLAAKLSKPADDAPAADAQPPGGV